MSIFVQIVFSTNSFVLGFLCPIPKNFIVLVSQLAIIFLLLLTCRHRDIYYRDPELFMKQAVVDRYVGDLTYTLGVERDALNVVRSHPLLDDCLFLSISRWLRPKAWLQDHSESGEKIIQSSIIV